MPFVIAFIVASLLRPLINLITRKTRIRRNFVSIAIVILFYALLIFLVTLLGVRIVSALSTFIGGLPDIYTTSIQPTLNSIMQWFTDLVERMDPSLVQTIEDAIPDVLRSIGTAVTNISVSLVGWLSGFLTSIPNFLIKTIFAIMSTIFIASDYSKISHFIAIQFSDKTRQMVRNIREQLGKTVFSYIKSYAIILLITFVELSLGFTIIGIKQAFLIGAMIAIFDILPVVGSAVVLIPWGIIALIQGDIKRGLGLLVLTVIITVIRNIIEPRIVGQQVGLHPLVTLMSMVIGVYLFGGIGILALPVTVAIIAALNRAGTISLFKYPKEEETSDGSPGDDKKDDGVKIGPPDRKKRREKKK